MDKSGLNIESYASDIHLFEKFTPAFLQGMSKEQLVNELLGILDESRFVDADYATKRRVVHAKLNTLAPHTLSGKSVGLLDTLLQLELKDKTVVSSEVLECESYKKKGGTNMVLWQGDITTLQIDAIVNAANNQLLGCFQPLHACIDNAIHTAAGVQLRDDCEVIMKLQGHAEPTGFAKLTRAYNLPSKFVIHTVGPIVQGAVTEKHRGDLASVYSHCLDACKEIETIRSIAFCGVSTGVFGYPAEEAAEVAYETVCNWLQKNPDCLDLVVFNVFSEYDRSIYREILLKMK